MDRRERRCRTKAKTVATSPVTVAGAIAPARWSAGRRRCGRRGPARWRRRPRPRRGTGDRPPRRRAPARPNGPRSARSPGGAARRPAARSPRRPPPSTAPQSPACSRRQRRSRRKQPSPPDAPVNGYVAIKIKSDQTLRELRCGVFRHSGRCQRTNHDGEGDHDLCRHVPDYSINRSRRGLANGGNQTRPRRYDPTAHDPSIAELLDVDSGRDILYQRGARTQSRQAASDGGPLQESRASDRAAKWRCLRCAQ